MMSPFLSLDKGPVLLHAFFLYFSADALLGQEVRCHLESQIESIDPAVTGEGDSLDHQGVLEPLDLVQESADGAIAPLHLHLDAELDQLFL